MEEKNLSQKLSEDIISLILEENLKPGDRLPGMNPSSPPVLAQAEVLSGKPSAFWSPGTLSQ